eukprot:jgi/Mesen1/3095/ME000184S02161
MAQLTALNSTLAALDIKVESSLRLSAQMWRITSAALVFLMQIGFSLIEAGTVRFKNTRNIMIKNVLDTCVCAMAFWLLGYALGFGSGSKVVGWEDDRGKIGFAGNHNAVEWFFQFTFAATSTTIIAGAVAERTQLWAYLLYNFVMSSVIYPIIAHLIWSDRGLLSSARGEIILGTNGVLDNAGSMVVHVTGGVTSLIGAWMVGPRIGKFDIDGNPVPFKGHSMVFVAAGTIMLWVGFFGFNGGSVSFIGQDPQNWANEVAIVCMNTTLSAAFSGMTVFILTHRNNEPNPEDTFNAVIGGLVAACATSSVVEPYAAMIVGIGAGLMYMAGVWCMGKLRIDDVVMAAPTHLFCGSWGGIAVGFFGTPYGIRRTYDIEHPRAWGIFHGGNGHLLGVQVGLDVAFHGGFQANFTNPEDSQRGGNLFSSRSVRKRFAHSSSLGGAGATAGGLGGGIEGGGAGAAGGLLAPPVRRSSWKNFLKRSRAAKAGGGAFQHWREVWHKALDNTLFGQFSLAMYEANYVMEDTGEVESSTSGVYIGVHDGHGGTETSEYLKNNMYRNLRGQEEVSVRPMWTRCMLPAHHGLGSHTSRNQRLLSCLHVVRGGKVTADGIRGAFNVTENDFTQLVASSFNNTPHFATVGACSVVAIITSQAIWVANVGDCRAVLGQVRKLDGGKECRAVQLSVDHNVNNEAVREKFIAEHADTPDAVVEKKGSFRVKGKVTVTRSFGDLYLKAHEFNREPLFARFRVPEPFHPPLLTADPFISVRPLTPNDAFVILASDGLFELLTNEEAVEIVASNPRKDISRLLIREALRRAAAKNEVNYTDLLRMPSGQRRSFHDDMTCVVFFFDPRAREKPQKNNQWHHSVSLKGGQKGSLDLIGDFELIGSKHGGLGPGIPEHNAVESFNNDDDVNGGGEVEERRRGAHAYGGGDAVVVDMGNADVIHSPSSSEYDSSRHG